MKSDFPLLSFYYYITFTVINSKENLILFSQTGLTFRLLFVFWWRMLDNGAAQWVMSSQSFCISRNHVVMMSSVFNPRLWGAAASSVSRLLSKDAPLWMKLRHTWAESRWNHSTALLQVKSYKPHSSLSFCCIGEKKNRNPLNYTYSFRLQF